VALTNPNLTTEQIRDVNVRYHDAAAESYDSKWAIDYGEVGARQVLMKLAKALGRDPGRYPRALEIGAGTGYFTINLLRQGVIERATATDISGGMLRRLAATAGDIGMSVQTARADAEHLPFEDASFDLVFGHAVLHHVPDLPRAMAEFRRVLAPGGTLAFMGEPSRHGDRLAAAPKRVGSLAAPLWRRAIGARPKEDRPPPDGTRSEDGSWELERLVDAHTFTPGELAGLASAAGFEDVRVSGEELIANAYGWLLRSLEARVEPTTVPVRWHRFAFGSYLALQRLDSALLEPRLPAGLFYNLLVSARSPS
jgi:ubiquinone/menaquinone biosynthesis C-methylase UbiE